MSGLTSQTFLSELAKVFVEKIAKVRGKHYVRIEDIDPIHAPSIVPIISELLNDFDERLLDYEKRNFTVGVLSKEANNNGELRIDDAIRIRNTEGRSLFLLVPALIDVPGSLNNSGDTVGLEDSFNDVINNLLARLKESDVAEIVSKLDQNLKNKKKANWAAFLAELIDDPSLKRFGSQLWQLGLVPDHGFEDLSTRLISNINAVRAISSPRKPSSVDERLNAAGVQSDAARIELKKFLSSVLLENSNFWCQVIAEHHIDSLSFEKWALAEASVSEIAKLSITSFRKRDGHVTPRCKLRELASDELLEDSAQSSDQMANNPLYCEVGINPVTGEVTATATVVVDWKTDSVNADPFQWLVEVILISELRDIDTSAVESRRAKGDKRSLKLSIAIDEDDLLFGNLFCIRVRGLNEEGEVVDFMGRPNISVEAESEEFEIHLTGSDVSPDVKPRSVSAISPAEAYLAVVVGGLVEPIEIFDYDPNGSVISITYVSPNEDSKLVSTEIRRIRTIPIFIELEREIFGDLAVGFKFEASSTFGGLIQGTDVSTTKIELPEPVSRAREQFLTELRTEARRGANRALIETVQWDDKIYELALEYAAAYNSALCNAGENDVAALLEIETVNFKVDIPGRTLEAIVVLPLHPSRILWLAEYDREIRSWAREYSLLRDRGDDPQVDLEMIGRIQPTNLPFVMPLKNERFCVYLDEIAFGCGFYLPLDGNDFQKSARMIEDSLDAQGSNFISKTRAELLTKRIGKFVASHSENETLSVIAVNPGSGEVLSSALGKFIRFDENEQKQFLDFRFEVKIYGNDFPFSKPVPHLQNLQETIRGAHPVGPVNHLMPPLGLTVRNRDQLEIDGDGAHIAIAQDLAVGELVQFEPERHRKAGLGGLLTGTHTVKIEIEKETKWVTIPSLAISQNFDLAMLHQNFLDAIRRYLGLNDRGLGVAVGLDSSTKNAIRALHARSDWVITIDRFIGIDWYEDSEAAGLEGAYVLDYTPDFVEGMGERLTVTTKHRVEIVRVLDRAMEELGFRPVGTESLILDNLASLSGRLALRLLDDSTLASEAVSLAVVIQYLKLNGTLEGKFLIPVDAHHEIFGIKAQGAGGSGRRCDMLIVGLDDSELSICCVEVKARTRAAVPIRLAEDIRDQLRNTQAILLNRFFGEGSNRIDRELQLAHFASVMHHYVDRAETHDTLSFEQASAYHEKIDHISEIDVQITLAGFVVALGADDTGFQQEVDGIPITLITNLEATGVGFTTVLEERTREESIQISADPVSKDDDASEIVPTTDTKEIGKSEQTNSDVETSDLDPNKTRVTQSLGQNSPEINQPGPNVSTSDSTPVAKNETHISIVEKPKSATVVLGTESTGSSVEYQVSTQGSPHAIIIGIPGQGKSVTTRRIINGFSEAGLPSLVFDFHGDMAANPPHGARVYDIRDNGLDFSPFEIAGHRQRDVNETSMAVSEIVEFVCELGEIQRQHVYRGIVQAFADLGWSNDLPGSRLPTIAEFANAVEQVEEGARGKNARGRLLPLTDFGLFKEGANEAFDPTGGGYGLIIDLSGVQLDSVKKAASSFVLRKVYRDMFFWEQDSTMKLNIVLDEAHRVLQDKTLPKLLKEGRKFGVSVVAASQSMADFSKQVIDNVGTKIVFRTNYPNSKSAANLIRGRDGRDLSKNLEQLGVGEAYVSTPTLIIARLTKMHDDFFVAP